MKITCVLGPFLPVPALLGGAVERIWENLCREFARRGHEVTVISRRFPGLPDDEMREGMRFIRVASCNAPDSRLLYRIADILYALRVVTVLPQSDITITNSVSLPVFLPARRAGRIYVSVARFPKRQMWLYRRAHRLQAVSHAVAEAIQLQSPRLAGMVKTVPNALSTTFTSLRPEHRLPRRREILFVGRMAREKGLSLLIRAFLQIRGHEDWTMTLLGPSDVAAGGDGPSYLAELNKLAEASRGRIRFEGAIYDEPVLCGRMAQAEIFVYPSVARHGESFGMAPLEAMSCGCALLVSSLACFQDFVVPGSNGLTFDQEDETGANLAAGLRELMNAQPLRDRLGVSALVTSQAFDVAPVATQFLRDFESLLSNTGSVSRPLMVNVAND